MWHTYPLDVEEEVDTQLRKPDPDESVFDFAIRENDGPLLDAVFHLEVLLKRIQYAKDESETERICALNAFRGDKSKGYYHAVSRMMTYAEMEHVYFQNGEILKRDIQTKKKNSKPWGVERTFYRCCGRAVGSSGCWKSLTGNEEGFIERPYLLWWDSDMTDIWRASTQREMMDLMKAKTQIGTAFLHTEEHHTLIQEVLDSVIRVVSSFMFGTLKPNMERNVWKYPIDSLDQTILKKLYIAQYNFNQPFHMCKTVAASAGELTWYSFLRSSVLGEEAACRVFGKVDAPVVVVVKPTPVVVKPKTTLTPMVVVRPTVPPSVVVQPPEAPPVVVTPTPSVDVTAEEKEFIDQAKLFASIFNFEDLKKLISTNDINKIKKKYDELNDDVNDAINDLPYKLIHNDLVEKREFYETIQYFEKNIFKWKIPDNLENPPNPDAWPLTNKMPKILALRMSNPGRFHLKKIYVARNSTQSKIHEIFFDGNIIIMDNLIRLSQDDYAIAMFLLYALDQYMTIPSTPETEKQMSKALYAAGVN